MGIFIPTYSDVFSFYICCHAKNDSSKDTMYIKLIAGAQGAHGPDRGGADAPYRPAGP